MAKDIDKYNQLKLLADLSRGLLEDAGVGVILPDRISRQGNRFTLRSSTEGDFDPPDPHALDFVMLAAKEPKARTYYADTFNADVATPPTCRSADSITPDVDHPQAATCATCPKSVWGSSVSPRDGKKVTACKQHKDLVIKVLGVPGTWFFDIPPNSFKPWGQVHKSVATAVAESARNKDDYPLGFASCVIRAEFDPKQMGTLKFKPLGYLGDAERSEVARLMQEEAAEIEEKLWGSPERRAQWERAVGRASPKPLEASPPPDKPPPPELPKNPPTPPPQPSNGPLSGDASVRHSRRAPYSKSGTVDTDVAFDALFNENFAGKPDE